MPRVPPYMLASSAWSCYSWPWDFPRMQWAAQNTQRRRRHQQQQQHPQDADIIFVPVYLPSTSDRGQSFRGRPLRFMRQAHRHLPLLASGKPHVMVFSYPNFRVQEHAPGFFALPAAANFTFISVQAAPPGLSVPRWRGPSMHARGPPRTTQ